MKTGSRPLLLCSCHATICPSVPQCTCLHLMHHSVFKIGKVGKMQSLGHAQCIIPSPTLQSADRQSSSTNSTMCRQYYMVCTDSTIWCASFRHGLRVHTDCTRCCQGAATIRTCPWATEIMQACWTPLLEHPIKTLAHHSRHSKSLKLAQFLNLEL